MAPCGRRAKMVNARLTGTVWSPCYDGQRETQWHRVIAVLRWSTRDSMAPCGGRDKMVNVRLNGTVWWPC